MHTIGEQGLRPRHVARGKLSNPEREIDPGTNKRDAADFMVARTARRAVAVGSVS